jgi:hypothetical protein
MDTKRHELAVRRQVGTAGAGRQEWLAFAFIHVHLWVIFAIVFASTGCVSKSEARRRQNLAFAAGQHSGAAQALQSQAQLPPTQAPTVTVRGEVRRNAVPWTEGLTLKQAILAAEHIGRREPRSIVLSHGDETITLDTRWLLTIGEDVPLAPGDVIDLVP